MTKNYCPYNKQIACKNANNEGMTDDERMERDEVCDTCEAKLHAETEEKYSDLKPENDCIHQPVCKYVVEKGYCDCNGVYYVPFNKKE